MKRLFASVIRRRSGALLASLACTAMSSPNAPAQSPGAYATSNTNAPALRRPSIILIVADDLGYGDLGCYGQKQIKTPNLDRLAREGMRFTDFYAGSTVCAPSRAALMLGKDTGHLGIRGNARGSTLQPGDVTLAGALQRGGYRTALIGKWGLTEPGLPGVPQRMGFDEFVGYLDNVHAHDYYPTYLWRYAPATEGQPVFDGKMEFPENYGGKRGLYAPDLCTTAALNYIRIHKPDDFNRHQPFFLGLCYTIPHANNEAGRRTGNGMEVPSAAPYTDETWPAVERNKAAMITRLDTDVGKILDRLRDLKIETNTVVLFTSDNGPHQEGGADPKFFQSAGPLRGIKRDLYEGGIRVPLIVRWPDQVPAGVVTSQVGAFWDLLPTLAQIARQKPPEGLDGISLLPTLLGGKQTPTHDYLYWEFHERGFFQAVRLGQWKGIRQGTNGPVELYNLQADLGEKTDVADRHPDIVAQITAIMQSARTDDPKWPALPAKSESAAPAAK